MNLPKKIVLATANEHKVKEIRSIAEIAFHATLRTELLPRPPEIGEIAETGATFLENARIKAEAISKATLLPALADDSGIVVDVLGDLPGVNSSRYAGEHATDADNLKKLLDDLGDSSDRTAGFITVMLLRLTDGTEFVGKGEIKGKILKYPRGNHGFGYDPIFQPDGYEMTFAEMDAADKDSISHRRLALISLFEQFL